MFVLSFKNGAMILQKNYFDKSYMPLVEIKDCNTWTENKPFFDQPVKNKQEPYEKLIEILRYLKKMMNVEIRIKMMTTHEEIH